uniref:Uncharacterized protein n=1 Tax=Vitis vinifera TaxID=29760 RepID=F6I5H5_VITVI
MTGKNIYKVFRGLVDNKYRDAKRTRPTILLLVSKRLRAEKTGNPVFLNLVPLLVGNVGPIFTKGDLKEVDEEVAKYKVGAPARTGLVAHIDVIAPPGNTGLNLAHTRASIKPISPTFSRVSIKVTLHHRQPPTLSIAPPLIFMPISHAFLNSHANKIPCMSPSTLPSPPAIGTR